MRDKLVVFHHDRRHQSSSCRQQAVHACYHASLTFHRSRPGPRVRHSNARKGNEDSPKNPDCEPAAPPQRSIKTTAVDRLACGMRVHPCTPAPVMSAARTDQARLQAAARCGCCVAPAESEEEQAAGRVECRTAKGRQEKQELQRCTLPRLERPNRPGKHCDGKGREPRSAFTF